jgi:hypothetical protein
MSKPFNLNKNSYTIRLSAEQVYWQRGFHDSRYNRKVERIEVTQPTEADWGHYRTAKAAHNYLLSSPYFEDGGPDERSTVNKPEPKREYIYAETHEEWLARCRALDQEETP